MNHRQRPEAPSSPEGQQDGAESHGATPQAMERQWVRRNHRSTFARNTRRSLNGTPGATTSGTPIRLGINGAGRVNSTEASYPPSDSTCHGEAEWWSWPNKLVASDQPGQPDRISLMHQLLARLNDFPHQVFDDYEAAMERVTPEIRYAHGCVMQAWLRMCSLENGSFQDIDTDIIGEGQQPKRLRPSGTAWMELRGRPVDGSLEIPAYNGMTLVTYGATFQVEVATGARVEPMLDHCARAALERQCQEIFATGDIVASGGLVLREDGPLLFATTCEPVISPG